MKIIAFPETNSIICGDDMSISDLAITPEFSNDLEYEIIRTGDKLKLTDREKDLIRKILVSNTLFK